MTTQEDKELLLKDLCARLPYKPKALVNGHLATILGIDEDVVIVGIDGNDYKDEIVVSADDNGDDIKLYLRPMSSTTEDETIEFIKLTDSVVKYANRYYMVLSLQQIDYFNAHHFDYRGLIPKGLAIEALEGMYREEE